MKRKLIIICATLIMALALFMSCENKTPVVETFTVTFDTDGGGTINPVTVNSGKTISKPKVPTKEGYVFKGWSTTKEIKDIFDFSTPITSDIKLIAIWEKDSTPEKPETPDEPDTPETPAVGTVFRDESNNLIYKVYQVSEKYLAIQGTINKDLIWACEIPEEYAGIKVTHIEYNAFKGCSGLTSITIPDGVTYIGDRSFQGCTSLTSISIPNSVTSIGIDAFYGCSGLESVSIGSSVTSIRDEAFSYCSSLTSITIPDSATSIGRDAFMGCSSLTSVTIGNSVKTIGNCAFFNCSSLSSISIPDSVTSIGNMSFDGCSGLKSVILGNSVTSIGETAFNGCTSLTIINIQKDTNTITGSPWGAPNSPTVNWNYK